MRLGVNAVMRVALLVVGVGLSSCDDAPVTDESAMTIYFRPYYLEQWNGITAIELETECDEVAVISADSYTAKRLLNYLEGGTPEPFASEYVTIRMVTNGNAIMVDIGAVVTGLPDQPDRYIGYDALRKFEILFYKINPKYRKPCQSATQ